MTWQHAGMMLFGLAILCEQGHVASPIVLAWSHPGLRRIALSRPMHFLLLPALAFAGAMLSPLWLLVWVYWAWNIYHFGSQHYGVSRILGWRVPRWVCIGGTAAIMVGAPLLHVDWWRWVALFALDFNHWLVDIGLSSWVSRCWWLFLGGIAAIGCIGFTFKVARVDHVATLAIPWVLKARLGAGIMHFLYSRWVWKLSDPQVRETIGRDLFAVRG
jgi:hypothetical protein